MDTNQKAFDIAFGIQSLIMEENPKRGAKCKVDADGGGDVENFGTGQAEFGMSKWIENPAGKPLGQWFYTVTVKAEYVKFEELNHTR